MKNVPKIDLLNQTV